MILLARRGTLALAVVVDIALHARLEPVAAKALAERLALPPRHLEPLLQALVRAGILRSIRGPRGGYELARERRRINAADILRASFAQPEQPESSPKLVEDVITPLVERIGDQVLEAFETVTVSDLCDRAIAAAHAAKLEDPADFTI